MKNRPFLLKTAPDHRSMGDDSPPLHPSRVVPLSFEHGLVLLTTKIRRGANKNDKGVGVGVGIVNRHSIEAKMTRVQMSVSRIFATGCSLFK